MGFLSDFIANFNWESLLITLLSAAATLLCFTVHELCHGLTALALGDPTAKRMGRLTMNPLKHVDLFGLLLMITVHVGWAKPVPIDMRNFKHPKRDMALTALAGPVSNFLLALVFLAIVRIVFTVGLAVPMESYAAYLVWFYVLLFFLLAALLSVGLGVFNLIPIPPLDGSKVLFSFFPDRIYAAVLRYERYIVLLLFLVMFSGVLDGPLSLLRSGVLRGLCFLSGTPFDLFTQFFGLI